jgi:hypothetical protein
MHAADPMIETACSPRTRALRAKRSYARGRSPSRGAARILTRVSVLPGALQRVEFRPGAARARRGFLQVELSVEPHRRHATLGDAMTRSKLVVFASIALTGGVVMSLCDSQLPWKRSVLSPSRPQPALGPERTAPSAGARSQCKEPPLLWIFLGWSDASRLTRKHSKSRKEYRIETTADDIRSVSRFVMGRTHEDPSCVEGTCSIGVGQEPPYGLPGMVMLRGEPSRVSVRILDGDEVMYAGTVVPEYDHPSYASDSSEIHHADLLLSKMPPADGS